MVNSQMYNDFIPEDEVNETLDANATVVKQYSLIEDVRKFPNFDFTKGKEFSTSTVTKGLICFFPLFFLLFIFYSVSTQWTLAMLLFGALGIVFSLWSISFAFQKTKIDCEGIYMKKTGFKHWKFLGWKDIDEINLYTQRINGIPAHCAEFITTSGEKERLNLSVLNESHNMIFNLILAYYNYYRNKDFEWSQIMRNPSEQEPITRSILMTIVSSLILFGTIFISLSLIINNTYAKYDSCEPKEVLYYGEIERLQDSLSTDYNGPSALLLSINEKHNLLIVTVGGRHGIYNYKTNSWLAQPSYDEYRFHSAYITKTHDKGNKENETTTFYNYDGSESTFYSILNHLPVYLATLSIFIFALPYYRNRRCNK